MPAPAALCLDRAATHVDIEPGGEIVVRGSLYSKLDGTTIDATTTAWPKEAPGGASVDSGGLFDIEAGGFHITARNPATHEVTAVATGEPAPACGEAGVEAPCIPLRLLPQARSRLITAAEWKDSLIGGAPGAPAKCFALEVHSTVIPAVPPNTKPYLVGGGVLLGALALATLAWKAQKRRSASPTGQLLALAKRVQGKLKTADPVLAATLTGALDTALRALRERRVDASSTEGERVVQVLRRVEVQLDETAAKARAKEEQEVADDLVRELESAIEAADEAGVIGGREPRR